MEGFFSFLSDEFFPEKKTLAWQKWSLQHEISEKKKEKRKKTTKQKEQN